MFGGRASINRGLDWGCFPHKSSPVGAARFQERVPANVGLFPVLDLQGLPAFSFLSKPRESDEPSIETEEVEESALPFGQASALWFVVHLSRVGTCGTNL